MVKTEKMVEPECSDALEETAKSPAYPSSLLQIPPLAETRGQSIFLGYKEKIW